MNAMIEPKTLDVLDNVGYAYFEADLSGRLTFVNDTFCQMSGYPRLAVLGRHFRHFTTRQDARQIYGLFNSLMKSEGSHKNIEARLKKQDGSIMIAEGRIAVLKDFGGKAAGMCGIFADITDRKRLEETMLQARQAAEHELQIGRRIQADFLPDSLPQPKGWEIDSYFKAAREVSGDFYDAFFLSGGKRIGLVVGDVCDKGVGAALFMALFRSLIRAFADQHYSLSWMDVLSGDSAKAGQNSSVERRRAMLSPGATALKNAIHLTNNYITKNHGRTNMFATIFFGVLDSVTGSLIYINGGQEPPLVIGPSGIKRRLEPTGPAVGLWPDLEFKIEQADLEPGDILLITTDGLLDARSPQGEFFGEERMLELAGQPAASAQALLQRLQQSIAEHVAGKSQYDDITIMAVKRENQL
ncbi:MAG TPA: SpoIIE family protein phosphatase [Anaerolineales bacterium]